MASRGGKRLAGTDGTDFMHRERVADHYNISALNKTRVKWTVTFHWAMLLLLLARLTGPILSLGGVQAPVFLTRLSLPPALLWELAWLPSIIASLFAYWSLRRNNSGLLKQAVLGQLLLGLLPVCYGLFTHYPQLRMYISKGGMNEDYLPFIPLIYGWLAICLQIHLFQIYFSLQLLSAWSPSTARKTQ